MTSIKLLLAAGALAVAGAAATPASAEVGVGLYFGPGGFNGVGIGFGVSPKHYHGHHYGYGHQAWGGSYCSKPEALDRAASMGVKKRFVSKVTDSRITVKGFRKGQPVKVVMYRNTGNCTVSSFDYV